MLMKLFENSELHNGLKKRLIISCLAVFLWETFYFLFPSGLLVSNLLGENSVLKMYKVYFRQFSEEKNGILLNQTEFRLKKNYVI